MWAHQEDLPHRAGKAYESDLSLRYLAPGAFTILPPGKEGPPPEASSAANKHRLSPATKTHRNAAFTIIAESESNAGSRSPSPTGRVSPFRGRGFNPVGSRHASPLPSPPPDDRRFPPSHNHQSDAAKRSKIPTFSRRGSTAELFGEATGAQAISPGRAGKRTNLTKQLSQSLTNITPKHVAAKPPPSPRRLGRMKRPTPFQKLSPIIGSSPEPTPDPHRLQSQSSPSKIPRSRSQPPSTRISPSGSRATSRATSRNPSRNASRNTSREPSPNKLNSKPSYRNVKAKVNSFNAVKPKVPPKPQVPKANEKQKLERKDSVIRSSRANDNKSKNDSKTNTNSSRINSSKNDDSASKGGKSRNKSATPSTTSKGSTTRTNKKAGAKSELEDVEDVEHISSRASSPDNESSPVVEKPKKESSGRSGTKSVESTPKLVELLGPSTTAVVSSTTTTVTQPLKIEAKFDVSKDDDKGDNTVYLPDARALSATSVSTAMNRMNDTVLDTKTLMKESNLSSRLSPAATTIISMSNSEGNSHKTSETVTTTTATTTTKTNNSALPPVETVNRNNNRSDPFGPEVNHNFNNSTVPSLNSNNNSVNTETRLNDTNGRSPNGISPERGVVGLSALPKSENERIKQARTMVATDVQPIRITVKEKPSDSEVQSGNVRLPVSATNGTIERPGIPPPHPPQEEPPATPEPPKGRCGRLLGCCRKKPKPAAPHGTEKKKRVWCFSKDKKSEPMHDRVSSDVSLLEEEANQKMKWWKKLKCCRRKKVGDTTGCFPKKQRKESWAERTDSIASEVIKKSPKDKCKDFLRTIFCINLCSRKRRKEQEEAINRRASLMSKKKSLTPPIAQDDTPKLDAGLVEHMSLMKGAIPVLPVPLAWMCLILNCFLPGIGTIISGFLCLCMGKARFSTKDGLKQRAGACFIDFFIGCGQLFTVLFCLVGWGWSIWWGVIMIKIAKKYRKIRRAEKAMEDDTKAAAQTTRENHLQRDPERGS